MERSRILISDLAEVLGEPSATLSQMFKRGGFTLPDADCRGGTGNWTWFSEADVAALALIRALTGLGMQVRTASEATQYVIEQRKVELTDIDRFIAHWRDARLVISRDDRGWHFIVFEGAEDLGGPAAYISLDVARIVDDAVGRARELAKRHEWRHAQRAGLVEKRPTAPIPIKSKQRAGGRKG
jgi:MerR HTH family regulatory protein